MTASNSSSLMDTSMRSRRMPALFTTTWRSPKLETAWSTMALAPANELTLSVLATAWPPAAVISSTTDWAAETSVPDPSTAPPRSLTTTFAPSDANRRACSRPMPRPPPVMIATLSCSMLRPLAVGLTTPPIGERSGARRLQRGRGLSNRLFAPPALQVAPLGVGAGQDERLAVGGGRLVVPAQPAQHVRPCRRQEVVPAERRRWRRWRSTRARPASGPSARETATARLSSTTADGAMAARVS